MRSESPSAIRVKEPRANGVNEKLAPNEVPGQVGYGQAITDWPETRPIRISSGSEETHGRHSQEALEHRNPAGAPLSRVIHPPRA
jgi:hypothetical protein